MKSILSSVGQQTRNNNITSLTLGRTNPNSTTTQALKEAIINMGLEEDNIEEMHYAQVEMEHMKRAMLKRVEKVETLEVEDLTCEDDW